MKSSYKSTKATNLHPFQQVAFLLNRCIHYMEMITKSIHSESIYEKAIFVDKVLVILISLGDIFMDNVKESDHAVFQEWQDYLQNAAYLVSLVNKNNDLHLASNIMKSFDEMAQNWLGFYEVERKKGHSPSAKNDQTDLNVQA